MKICTKCKEEKNILQFNKKSSSKDGLSKHCKLCNSKYLKEHYIKNSQYYKDKSVVHRKSFSNIIDEIKNQPCIDCGIKYPPYVMDFDHIKGNKEFNISSGKSNYSREKVLKEIDKCELVCANCHRIRTYKRNIAE